MAPNVAAQRRRMEQNRDQIEFVYGRFAGQKQRGTDLRSYPEINYPNFTRIDAAHRRSPGDQASVRLQALIGWTGPHRDLGWRFPEVPLEWPAALLQ